MPAKRTRRAASLTEFAPAVVVSNSSSSPLAELYASPEFRDEWDNNVMFHVSQNLLFLRRYRRWSQARVAKQADTSQPAIARIESAQENITLATLEKIINGLKGRLRISIAPQEVRQPEWPVWWEALATGCPVSHSARTTNATRKRRQRSRS